MTKIENRMIIQNSLISEYYLNKDEQKNILKQIEDKGIIIGLESDIVLNGLLRDLDDIEKIKEIIKLIEEYEYKKMYTYSFMYEINYKKEELLKKIKENSEIFNKNELDEYSNKIEKPSLKIEENKIYIKFAKVVKHKETAKYIKYPTIVEIFLEENFFQIKFEPLESGYQIENQNIFLKICADIELWIEKELKINFKDMKTFEKASDLIVEINKNSQDYENVSEFLDYGKDQHDGDIKIKANRKNKLPLFYELRNLLDKFECENDKEILETFLQKLDVTIERYKRGIEWSWRYGNSDKKSRIILVFTKQYNQTSKTLVHMYYNSQLMERRDYVIKYIARYNRAQPTKEIQ